MGATLPGRVAIVAANASLRFGGEAAIPYQYFAQFERSGLAPLLFVHARCREELLAAFPAARERMIFVPDSRSHKLIHRIGALLPGPLREATLDVALRLLTQRVQVRQLRALRASLGIAVVHQPTPVSPLEPTLLHLAGLPLIVGPMNGAMRYPPGYEDLEGRGSRWIRRLGKRVARMPMVYAGKREARALLVANRRTLDALPTPLRHQARMLPENGVDLDVWTAPTSVENAQPRECRFVFVGRLVRWKNVEALIRAFRIASARAPMSLTIVGSGGDEAALRALAVSTGIVSDDGPREGAVGFAGWLPQARCADLLRRSDCLVLPSVWECGGAVVLEAMACGLPVVASAWGGPVDYLDEACGVLVAPSPREDFAERLSAEMVALAEAPERRRRLGLAGRAKAESRYSWRAKADALRALYAEALAPPARS